MPGANVGITVTWAGQPAIAGIDRLERKFDELIRTVQQTQYAVATAVTTQVNALRRVDGAVDGTRRRFNLLRATMLSIGAIAGLTFVANIVRNVGLFAIETAGEFETLVRQLILVEGSSEAAATAISRLGRELVSVGGVVSEGLGLYARLSMLGVQNAERLSVAVSGLAGTFGLSTDQIQRTNLAITQMFSKGTMVRAEEFNQQLQESLPAAASIAALGFQRLGNTALDTVQEIQRAVQNSTLRVSDFYAALIEGADTFVSRSAALLNVRTNWAQLTDAIRLAVGVGAEMNGVGAAFALVMRAATEAILDYTSAWGAASVPEQARQVTALTQRIIGVVRSVEVFGRTVGLVFTAINAGITALITPFQLLGRQIGTLAGFIHDVFTQGFDRAAATMLRRSAATVDAMRRNGAAIAAPFEEMVRRGQEGFSPIADNLEARIPDTGEIEALISDARSRSAEIAELRARLEREAQNQPAAEDAASRRAAARLRAQQDRLIEMMEQLQGLENRVAEITAEELSPVMQRVADATQPFTELTARYTDLRTDLERLRLESPAVAQAMDVIAQAQQRLADASGRAAERAQALYNIEQQLADLDVQDQVSRTQREVEDLVQQVTVRFESEGQERVRSAERDLTQQRIDNAREVQRLELEQQQARLGNDLDLVARIQLQIDANQQLGVALNGVSGAMIVAAERARALIASIRSSVQNATSDLIEGLVNEGIGFDFAGWARGLINNITSAIAEDWSQSITDQIFSFLGIGGDQQEVRTMNVATMNVAGGLPLGGAQQGGILGGIGSFLSNPAGGIGNFFSGITSGIGNFFSNIPWFGDGGIVGGPTLFGAGEKGKEGVLPLERVGGRLGVNATMGNNVQATIQVQAIDAQTGAQFLMRNSEVIVGLLQKEMALGNY